MFQPNQRMTVDMSGLVIQGVSFSRNVQKALGTILQQMSTDPPVYKVERLFSFKRVKQVDVPGGGSLRRSPDVGRGREVLRCSVPGSGVDRV
jgi:hypothetical protein